MKIEKARIKIIAQTKIDNPLCYGKYEFGNALQILACSTCRYLEYCKQETRLRIKRAEKIGRDYKKARHDLTHYTGEKKK